MVTIRKVQESHQVRLIMLRIYHLNSRHGMSYQCDWYHWSPQQAQCGPWAHHLHTQYWSTYLSLFAMRKKDVYRFWQISNTKGKKQSVKRNLDHPLFYFSLYIYQVTQSYFTSCNIYGSYHIVSHGLIILHSLMFRHQRGVLSSFLADLEWAAFGRVKNQEAAQDSFTVCRHVERYTVLPSQNTLTQFLNTTQC